MRKLYARYSDDRLVELAIPDSVHIWNENFPDDPHTIFPLGWKLDGWEGWLDTEGLRSLVILDERATDAALGSSGASEEEIADLRRLVREGQAKKEPAVLEGGTQ